MFLKEQDFAWQVIISGALVIVFFFASVWLFRGELMGETLSNIRDDLGFNDLKSEKKKSRQSSKQETATEGPLLLTLSPSTYNGVDGPPSHRTYLIQDPNEKPVRHVSEKSQSSSSSETITKTLVTIGIVPFLGYLVRLLTRWWFQPLTYRNELARLMIKELFEEEMKTLTDKWRGNPPKKLDHLWENLQSKIDNLCRKIRESDSDPFFVFVHYPKVSDPLIQWLKHRRAWQYAAENSLMATTLGLFLGSSYSFFKLMAPDSRPQDICDHQFNMQWAIFLIIGLVLFVLVIVGCIQPHKKEKLRVVSNTPQWRNPIFIGSVLVLGFVAYFFEDVRIADTFQANHQTQAYGFWVVFVVLCLWYCVLTSFRSGMKHDAEGVEQMWVLAYLADLEAENNNKRLNFLTLKTDDCCKSQTKVDP